MVINKKKLRDLSIIVRVPFILQCSNDMVYATQ